MALLSIILAVAHVAVSKSWGSFLRGIMIGVLLVGVYIRAHNIDCSQHCPACREAATITFISFPLTKPNGKEKNDNNYFNNENHNSI